MRWVFGGEFGDETRASAGITDPDAHDDQPAEEIPEPELDIACWVNFEDLGDELLEELSLLEPYGQMNPEPILGLKRVMLRNEATTFANVHKRFSLIKEVQPEKWIEGIAWNFDSMPNANQPLDLAVRLEWNIWNNKKTIQLNIKDLIL